MRLSVQLFVAFVVLVASVILGAIGGGLIGRYIASNYPAYYQTVFSEASTQPEFDVASMGIAMGIGQGAAMGVLVGCVTVLALAIVNRRRVPPSET